MQIESGKQDIAIRQASLREVISSRGCRSARAGWHIKVREIKLLLLDAELELQRTERAVFHAIGGYLPH